MTNPPPPGQPWQTPATPGLGTPEAGQSPAVSGGGLPGTVPPSRPAKKQRRRVPGKVIVAVVLLAALIWFIAVNTHDAKITVFVPTYNVPVWIVLLGTFIVGWVIGALFRRRRQSIKAKAIRNNL